MGCTMRSSMEWAPLTTQRPCSSALKQRCLCRCTELRSSWWKLGQRWQKRLETQGHGLPRTDHAAFKVNDSAVRKTDLLTAS